MIRARAAGWVLPALCLAGSAHAAPDPARTVSATPARGPLPPPPSSRPPPRVAVVAGGSDGADPLVGETVNRVRFELAAAGLLGPDKAQAPDYLVGIVREGDRLVAEVQGVGQGGRAPAPVRRIELGTTTGTDRAAVAAIRAVELVRATILQVAVSVDPVRTQVSASPSTAPAPAPAAPGGPLDPGRPFQAGFGLAAVQSLGGINTGFGFAARIGVLLARSISLELKLAAPAIARDRALAQGTVSVWQMMAGLGLGYGLGARRALQPSLSVLGGYYLAGFSSHPPAGQGVSAQVAAPFVSLGAGLAVLAWGTGSLRLEADAVFIEPALHVTLGGMEVGRTGRPLLVVSLRLDRAAAFHRTR